MNGEIISIDRLDEHEKLIRENGYLRTERNKLKDRIDKAKTRISLIQMEDSTNKETREVLNNLLKILRGEDNANN